MRVWKYIWFSKLPVFSFKFVATILYLLELVWYTLLVQGLQYTEKFDELSSLFMFLMNIYQ